MKIEDYPEKRNRNMSFAYLGEVLPKATQLVGYTWLLENFN